METGEYNENAKRMKRSLEVVTEDDDDVAIVRIRGEETEGNTVGSEQMLADVAQFHDKIQCFTQLVSELLESGKSMLKELSNDFEEKLILIHKEQMSKWEEEIQELHLLDAANEEINAVLQNAKAFIQSIHGES